MASFLLMWPFARLDFDRHHDGYMLAQAIAVHQGASIHADVFAQYGPVTAWLQSLALFLPMGPGLALRTINVGFIAVTVFLLADMGRRTPQRWPVTRAAGWWAAVAWIVLADLWLGIPMLPWSSTLGAMLTVGMLYLFTRSMRCAEDGSSRTAAVTALAGGALLGLVPFTRINVGLSACAVCIVVAVLVLITERGVKGRSAGLFLLGVLVSFLTVVAVLAGTGSLGDYYYQSITWPLSWGQKAADMWQTKTYLTTIFILQAPPVTLVGAALLLQSRARNVQLGWSVTRSGANIFTVLVGLIVVAWENLRLVFDAPGEIAWNSLGAVPLSYLRMPNNQYMFFFMVLLVVTAVLTCVIFAFKYVYGRAAGSRTLGEPTSSAEVAPWLLLGGLTLSGLTQIIPTWDPKHVWWAAPIGLLLVFSAVGALSSLGRPSGNPLAIPLLLTAVMAIWSASDYLGLERVPGKPGTIIEGMLLKKEAFSQIEQDTAFLRTQLGSADSVVYLADNGDLSVLDGTYRSADSFFVDWGGSPLIQTRVSSGNPIVVQKSAYGEDRVSALARSVRYRVVASNPRLVVLMPVDRTAR